MTPQEIEQKSARIAGSLLATQAYRRARVLSLYFPIRNEVVTEEIFRNSMMSGKSVVLPRVKGTRLEFSPVKDLRNLCEGPYGTREPSGATVCPVGEIDLFIVPGVAFDRHGNRLGYGKGYFDSLLRRTPRAPAYGLSFEVQIYDGLLPAGPGDAKVDVIITEDNVIERAPHQEMRHSRAVHQSASKSGHPPSSGGGCASGAKSGRERRDL